MTGAQRADARRLVAELTEQVRQLSMDLRPAALDAYGVLPALRGYIERYEVRTGIMIELRTEGLERRFPAPVEITVYRIAQEALTNMARHSGTQHAVMQLLADEHMLAVSIRDTGRGFDPLAVTEGSGLGGMRERVELLGGTLDIDAVPGSGVTITAELPLSAETEDEQP
jgi:signal transduction histidine kinase